MSDLVKKMAESLIDGSDRLSIDKHCVLIRASDPEVLTVNPGLIFALIASQPQSWWWAGGQFNSLCYFEDGIPKALLQMPVTGSAKLDLSESTSTLTIDLCESGRFWLVLTERDGRGWVLLDKERELSQVQLPDEITRSGGNEPGVLAQATVTWNDAWEAVVGFFITNGGREPSLNWHEYDDVEARYGRELLQT